MNPCQHSEVFVAKDRAECHLDLGRCERFINELLPGTASVSSGRAYKSGSDRHRRRYEFINAYTQCFEEHGMAISGRNPRRNLDEIAEVKEHPSFVAARLHPAFRCRPDCPHPLFPAFDKAALAMVELT